MPRAIVLAAAVGLSLGWASATWADGYRLHHSIPRLVPGYDARTGGEYMAPPIPYGHYAKNHLYDPHYLMECMSKGLHGHGGCGQAGCGHHGQGNGTGCGACGGKGCGLCSGAGLFGHGGGSCCVVPGCDGGTGCGHHGKAGRFAPMDGGPGCVVAGYGHGDGFATTVVATSQSPAVAQPSAQSACGQAGCGIVGRHGHGNGHGKHARRCGQCGGRGCGGCGGAGTVDGCGDPGCGLCNGSGHGKGCGFCGGKGCSHCLSGLFGKNGSLLGRLHKNKVDYFVGPGGPVPITPGYVPYVVTTRSPRDFFAFAPMNPAAP
jgi:hypothetical protein